MKINHIISNLMLICSISLLTTACGEKKEAPQQTNMALPVEAYEVRVMDVPLIFEYPARLKSPQSVQVRARVQGFLQEQLFKEGDYVVEGQILFKIDPRRYQALADVAKGNYESARATLIQAEQNWNRAEALFSENALSPKEYDDARASYDLAKANVESTHANWQNALIDLDYTTVKATGSGKVGMRQFDIGTLVGNGSNDILTTITQTDPMYGEFSIPYSDYATLRQLNYENTKVEFVLSNGQTYQTIGDIDFVDSVLDDQTASVKARAIVANPNNILLAGDVIRVRLINITRPNSVAIPQEALMQSGNGSSVYTIKNGVATPTPVSIGKSLPQKAIVIENGLKEGDLVITNQLMKVRPSAPVQVANKRATLVFTTKIFEAQPKELPAQSTQPSATPTQPNTNAETNSTQSQG